jgi:hypothetical protein
VTGAAGSGVVARTPSVGSDRPTRPTPPRIPGKRRRPARTSTTASRGDGVAKVPVSAARTGRGGPTSPRCRTMCRRAIWTARCAAIC